MKYLICFFFSFCLAISAFSQPGNLLPVGNWTVGSGSVSPFTAVGGSVASTYNQRFLDDNPFAIETIIWEVSSRSDQVNNGGFTVSLPSSDNVSYRYSLWVKRNADSSCPKVYLGAQNHTNASGNHSVTNLNGDPVSNPYFWWGSLPSPEKWYLMVGYLYETGYNGPVINKSGLFDPETGDRILTGEEKDFIQVSGENSSRLRTYFIQCNDKPNAKVQFWNPRVEVIDGNELPLCELMQLSCSGESLWTQTGNNIYYDQGVVGINMDDTEFDGFDTDFKLLVNGDVQAKRVKVSPTGWADFVFADDYELPTLKSVEAFISKNKHLPDMPSEREVLEQGVYLDNIDTKLLQKVEELTLYLIAQEKRIDQLEVTNQALNEALKILIARLSKEE